MTLRFDAALDERGLQEAGERTYPVLDLEQAKGRFPQTMSLLDTQIAEIRAIEIKTEEDGQKVSFAGNVAAKLIKEIEGARDRIIDDHEEVLNFVGQVKNFAKIWIDKAKELRTLADAKEKRWLIFKEQIRQEMESKAREEAERIKRQLEAEAAEKNRLAQEAAKKDAEEQGHAYVEPQKIEAPVIVEAIVPKKDTVTRTEAGSSSSAKTWTWEIEEKPESMLRAIAQKIKEAIGNQEFLPAIYLEEIAPYIAWSDFEIQNAVKRGIRRIPGVHIYEDINIKRRTK